MNVRQRRRHLVLSAGIALLALVALVVAVAARPEPPRSDALPAGVLEAR
ncbi:MAG: hypothetical protein Kow0062_03500 [Acidobacteriota bacterium]